MQPLIDTKGRLLVRRQNLQAEFTERQKVVACIEADLVRARAQAAASEGAIQATDLALGDVEAAIQVVARKEPGPPDGR